MSLLTAMLATVALADPCGMVPPIWTGNGPAPVGIERTGLQQTYVFHRDGVQTIAIRPGFTGSVEEFGMLVPLPAVPALRKIDDRTFQHLAAAVDPPPLTVHVVEQNYYPEAEMSMAAGAADDSARTLRVMKDEVRVVKEEAVGMYEVAVLEAGSSSALKRWMDDNRFRYPNGMDDTVDEYVDAGWMFVAVKTKVSEAGPAGLNPQPGMREVKQGLSRGASFDGYVQGMAFRFRVAEAVLPMRLSTFNGDDTHNRVYVLATEPVRIPEVGRELVRRQVRGRQLHDNVTELLPMEFQGPKNRVTKAQIDGLASQRDPAPYNGVARDLFAGDLLAERRGELSLPFEEREKELLRINEALNLRGAAIDQQVEADVAAARSEALEPALADLYEMTLTVVDGELPMRTLRDENLHLARYDLPASRNRFEVWNDRPAGPQAWVYLDGGGGIVPW